MEIGELPELLGFRLVACQPTRDATAVEVRGRRIGVGFFGLVAGPCPVYRAPF